MYACVKEIKNSQHQSEKFHCHHQTAQEVKKVKLTWVETKTLKGWGAWQPIHDHLINL